MVLRTFMFNNQKYISILKVEVYEKCIVMGILASLYFSLI
uniref:Uncharacterized protein n=1 Tax=Anguilla anguilla TaxID=7936 RepID=A0A0E9WG92_ANGAN